MTKDKSASSIDQKVPITQHIHELRRVLIWCVAMLVGASFIAYAFFDPLLKLFQYPLDQTLYYTSPAGGFAFVIKLCITVGVLASIPLLVNRIFSFTKPAVPKELHRSFAWYSLFSVVLALAGVAFAYIVSLPAALEFLTNFNSGDIEALITVDSYFTFFSTYLIGYALLFQTPIIMLFINKVKPINPGSAMKYQRHVIVGSFIVAAILTPTPDPWNQTLMAVPVILLYQIGIILIWMVNRKQNNQPVSAEFNVPAVAHEEVEIKSLIDEPYIEPETQPSFGITQQTVKAFDIIAPRQVRRLN